MVCDLSMAVECYQKSYENSNWLNRLEHCVKIGGDYIELEYTEFKPNAKLPNDASKVSFLYKVKTMPG